MILVGRVDERELLNLIGDRKGSVVCYFGYVRGENNGKTVKEMVCTRKNDTDDIMGKIEKEIEESYPVERVILYHSLGTLRPGQLLAAVVVSSVHREEGFNACRYGIDRIKELEPVKREERYEAV